MLDLDVYRRPPQASTFEDIDGAQLHDGVLHVCNEGARGILSALDAGTGASLWQSPPGTCNAPFAFVDDLIVAGYEADVVLVRRADGAVLQKVRTPGKIRTLMGTGTRFEARTRDDRVTTLELK